MIDKQGSCKEQRKHSDTSFSLCSARRCGPGQVCQNPCGRKRGQGPWQLEELSDLTHSSRSCSSLLCPSTEDHCPQKAPLEAPTFRSFVISTLLALSRWTLDDQAYRVADNDFKSLLLKKRLLVSVMVPTKPPKWRNISHCSLINKQYILWADLLLTDSQQAQAVEFHKFQVFLWNGSHLFALWFQDNPFSLSQSAMKRGFPNVRFTCLDWWFISN